MAKFLVIGSSGETGKALVSLLLANEHVAKVTAVGRRKVLFPTQQDAEIVPPEPKEKVAEKVDEVMEETETKHPKLTQEVIDYDKLDDYKHIFQGHDSAFSCLGTTRKKSGVDGFRKVDYDYVVNTAKLCHECGTPHFGLVTSTGSNADSYFLYPQVKGQAENAIKELGFSSYYIYRPSALETDTREEPRFLEGVVQGVMKGLNFMVPKKFKLIHVKIVAAAMMNDALRIFAKQEDPIPLSAAEAEQQYEDSKNTKTLGPSPSLENAARSKRRKSEIGSEQVGGEDEGKVPAERTVIRVIESDDIWIRSDTEFKKA